MGTGQGAGIRSSHFHELESCLGRDVKLFCEFSKIHDFRVPDSAVTAWVLALNRSSGGKKNCTVYSLVCIFIIIIIIVAISSRSINIISSISFVVLLNSLYLNSHAVLFVHFSSPSRRTETEKEGWGSRTEVQKKPATGSTTGREEKRIGTGTQTETDGERQKKSYKNRAEREE